MKTIWDIRDFIYDLIDNEIAPRASTEEIFLSATENIIELQIGNKSFKITIEEQNK